MAYVSIWSELWGQNLSVRVWVKNMSSLTRMRLLGWKERVRWTGLHRILDSTVGMGSMKVSLLGWQEREAKEARRELGLC